MWILKELDQEGWNTLDKAQSIDMVAHRWMQMLSEILDLKCYLMQIAVFQQLSWLVHWNLDTMVAYI
jgi:hypothetical protein